MMALRMLQVSRLRVPRLAPLAGAELRSQRVDEAIGGDISSPLDGRSDFNRDFSSGSLERRLAAFPADRFRRPKRFICGTN